MSRWDEWGVNCNVSLEGSLQWVGWSQIDLHTNFCFDHTTAILEIQQSTFWGIFDNDNTTVTQACRCTVDMNATRPIWRINDRDRKPSCHDQWLNPRYERMPYSIRIFRKLNVDNYQLNDKNKEITITSHVNRNNHSYSLFFVANKYSQWVQATFWSTPTLPATWSFVIAMTSWFRLEWRDQ